VFGCLRSDKHISCLYFRLLRTQMRIQEGVSLSRAHLLTCAVEHNVVTSGSIKIRKVGLSPLNNCMFKEIMLGYVRFEVFTAVTMKNGVFWDAPPCGSCKNRRLMEALISSETWVLTRSTRPNIQKNVILYASLV
jgi:hypothetical protein